MSHHTEPTPPAHHGEDFPKTTTIPDGWVTDCLMDKYNQSGAAYDRGTSAPQEVMPVPATGAAGGAVHGKVNGKSNGKAVHVEPQSDPGDETESLFLRRLEPFPSQWDVNGMWL